LAATVEFQGEISALSKGEPMKRIVLTVGVIFCAFAGRAFAQTITGTISGTLKDTTGSAVVGAKVEVINTDSGSFRNVQTDASGHYSVPALGLGSYRVTVTQAGFETEVRDGIVLTVDREAIVDLTLTVGSVNSRIEVTAEAPLVEATTASLGSLVDERTMRNLPLNGRSYDQLALLQPGVTRTTPGTFSNTSYTFGSGVRFSVGGQRTVANSFLMDGTNVNDQGNGTPGGANGLNLGMDTIQEFKIYIDAFKAEYGYATGSVTSVATKTGTNRLHGVVFEYIRNSALDARNVFDATPYTPPFKRNQFGGAIGGPMKRDKTFFYAGYEGLRQGLETTQVATVPTALAKQGILPYGTYAVSPAIVPYLNLYPGPNGRDFGDGTAQYLSSPNQISNDNNVMGRIDHQLTEKMGIFGRYIFDQDSLNIPLSLPGEFTEAQSRRQYATLQLNSVLTPTIFNGARFAFNRTRSYYQELFLPSNDPANSLSFVPGQPMGALNVGGGTQGGVTRTITGLGFASGNGNIDWNYNIFQLADDISRIVGKHTLKAGFDLQRMQDNFTQPSQLRGTYTFSQFTTLLSATPSTFQATLPAGAIPEWGLRQSLIGTYIQDDYRVSPRLMLNLGFRWETTTDPTDTHGQGAILTSLASANTTTSSTFISIGKRNFEPRLGLAWQLDDSGKSVVRAGFGIFHNLIYPWLYSQVIEVPPFYSTRSATNPSFPNGFVLLNTTGLVALKIANPVEKTPADYQYNLSFQREIFNHTVLQVAYTGNVGNHNQLSYEGDTAIPTICSGSNCPSGVANGATYYPVGSTRINPAWAGERIYADEANSSFNGGTVTLRRQFSSGLQGQLFYTYSKALDVETATATSDSQRSPNAVLNPVNPGLDWGLSDYNSKHDFGYYFTFALPGQVDSRVFAAILNGWILDGIGTFDSGLPFTARLSTSVSRDLSSVLVERPNLNPGFSNNPTQGTTGAGCSGISGGIKLGGRIMFYNPCAFSVPIAGTYGNVGRNTIVGPRLDDVDFALQKNFHAGDHFTVNFRSEVFNILNHPNLGLPNSSALNAQGNPNASAGVVTYTTTSSRQLQFGLRVAF
jgi:hypothetical protein